MNVSRPRVELALVSIDIARKQRSRRNGGAAMSSDLERALEELHAAQRGSTYLFATVAPADRCVRWQC